MFTEFNLFLQREDPCIHVVHKQCASLPSYIAVIIDPPNPTEVDYIHRDNQLEDSALFIGFTTEREKVVYHQLKQRNILKAVL